MFTGTAKRKLYFPVHQICLSEETRKALLAFHSITGWDTTSQFVGIGKQSSWSIFVTYPRPLQHLGKDESPEAKVLCDLEIRRKRDPRSPRNAKKVHYEYG